jgi:HAD superfamily hydrolase (TIGR01484 family)
MVPELRRRITVTPRAWCAETCTAAQNYLEENERVVEQVAAADHVVGLATGWAMPSLLDFESKFVEGGLGWIEIAEGKNFTHGRFVNSWRRKSGTAIVLLATLDNQEFINSFREAYQTTFPILTILSTNPGALGGLELFLFVFYLFRTLGRLRSINISSPEIPNEARTMFRGGALYKGLALREKLTPDINVITELKRSLLRMRNTREEEIERTVPRPVVAASITDLYSTKFAGLVCDYDGTLVSLDKKDDPLDRELVLQLERLLREEIRIAIITGRGGSAFESLQVSINPSLHHLVYCYLNNGGVLKRLDADKPLKIHKLERIELMERRLNESTELKSCLTRLKVAKYSSQITANLGHPEQSDKVLCLINALLVDFQSLVQVRTSGSSVDIFPRSVSKRTACDDFKDRLGQCSENPILLILGDSGQEDGNDFELLQQRFSLSVDRFHWVPSTCFPVLDLDRASIRGPAATLDVLKRIVTVKPTFILKEKEV